MSDIVLGDGAAVMNGVDVESVSGAAREVIGALFVRREESSEKYRTQKRSRNLNLRRVCRDYSRSYLFRFQVHLPIFASMVQ